MGISGLSRQFLEFIRHGRPDDPIIVDFCCGLPSDRIANSFKPRFPHDRVSCLQMHKPDQYGD
jgi:hypothetical protein